MALEEPKTPVAWLTMKMHNALQKKNVKLNASQIMVGDTELSQLLAEAHEYEEIYEAMRRDYVRLKMKEAVVNHEKEKKKQ